jgi:arylsulfatase A-like enzyme
MIDDLVGRIVEALEALGCDEQTVIAFSTDHGDTMGAHRLIEKGPFTYEQCYRLPLVVAHPDCETPGSASDAFVYLHDLFSTFLEVAGRPAPDVPDGASLRDLVLGRGGTLGRESVYAQFSAQIFTYKQRMVRTGTHKLVYNLSDIGELYDLVHDPWEMRNLIDLPEARGVQRELMERMREHMVRLEDPALREFDRIRHVY